MKKFNCKLRNNLLPAKTFILFNYCNFQLLFLLLIFINRELIMMLRSLKTTTKFLLFFEFRKKKILYWIEISIAN